jgi:hypothetical protein
MHVTPIREAGQGPGDPEVLFRMAEAQAAGWGRHRRDCIGEIRRVLPSWPDDPVLVNYLIAFSFLGYARGLDEPKKPRKPAATHCF